MGVALDVEQVFDVEQPKDVAQPKEVEQAQKGGTGPKINHTCFLADLASLGQQTSLRSAPRFAGQL